MNVAKDPKPPHAIRIGCAGWAIPREHRHLFGDIGSTLERYASALDAVEINTSFYRPHQAKTYERWASAVPAHFHFSVKIPKAITHQHKLRGTTELMDLFLDQCLHLGDNLGGLLVQLPPSLQFDGRRANGFFAMLRRRLPERISVACEPRHASWFGPNARAIFARYQVNRVAADPPPAQGIAPVNHPSETGQWRYWRLHGSPRMYYSGYSRTALAGLVPELINAASIANVWVIFDNTASGHAALDAMTLMALIAGSDGDGHHQ